MTLFSSLKTGNSENEWGPPKGFEELAHLWQRKKGYFVIWGTQWILLLLKRNFWQWTSEVFKGSRYTCSPAPFGARCYQLVLTRDTGIPNSKLMTQLYRNLIVCWSVKFERERNNQSQTLGGSRRPYVMSMAGKQITLGVDHVTYYLCVCVGLQVSIQALVSLFS